jgi:FMN phosphatase YigB (HAD superfamily)
MKREVSLLVTDLDNTLYDWVGMWYQAFEAMLKEIERISGISREKLEPEIQKVFQQYGTTEYAFLIQEIPSLRKKHPDEDLTVVYNEAIKAYRLARTETLKLYPNVLETLNEIKQCGSMIVVFTESMGFYTMRRLKVLGLDGLLDFVYSPPDHRTPENLKRLYKEKAYKLEKTIHKNIPEGEYKPNPQILKDIINADGIKASSEKTVYMGDSLMKDIKMAQDAGIIDVHAKYGVATNSTAYEVLRRVTHWTKEDVEREKRISAGGTVYPRYTLENSISELFDYFEFIPHKIEKK